MTEGPPQPCDRSFFGRRRGKTLRPQQAAALESGFGAFRIDLTLRRPTCARLFGSDVSSVHLEIGFGGGEHLLHRATAAQRPALSASSLSSTAWPS